METIGRDLTEMQRLPLTAQHFEAIRALGSATDFAAGGFPVQPGDAIDRVHLGRC